MAYNLHYTSQFASTEPMLNYVLNIYQKDYEGTIKDIILGGIPAVQEWQDDDPKKAIKGCTLSVNIINTGVVQLFDFYSNEDDTFLIELKRIETDQVLFKGYLLQSDCEEIQVDYYHEIRIVATDNLGLLKDITLGQAASLFGYSQSTYGSITRGDHQITFVTYETPPIINIGSSITVNGHTYTVSNVTLGTGPGYGAIFDVVEYVPVFTSYMGNLDWTTPIDLEGYLTYAQIIALCLKATQLRLGCYVYSQIYPIGGDTGRWLDDTFVLGNTFKEGNSWNNCYDVLEKIMSRFYASCFQSEGKWQIVRWGELWDRRTSTGADLLGWSYDTDMFYQSDITVIKDFYYGEGSDIGAGLLRSILRPYEYTKELFRYVQPEVNIFNIDLQELGTLIDSQINISFYEFSNVDVYTYTALGWYSLNGININIKVIKDHATNDELDRQMFVYQSTWQNYNDFHAFKSSPLQVNKNDTFKYSVSFRSVDFFGVNPQQIYFNVKLTTASGDYYYNNNSLSRGWSLTSNIGMLWDYNIGGSPINWPPGINLKSWHDVGFDINAAPEDGILELELFQINNTGLAAPCTTAFKNIKIIVTPSDVALNNATGHTHKDSQSLTLKNNGYNEIYIDDAYRSTIKGCQFLYSFTGELRNKTTLWQYQTAPFPDNIKLGQITTFEELFQRYIPRTKYNGTLLNIHQGEDEGYMLSNLAVIKLKLQTDMRYVPGAISVDYKSNTADVTLWEITAVGENYNTLNVLDLYEFKYLYEKS